MIRRLLPHPVLTVLLALLWMVLTRFSPGNLVLGTGLGLFAGWTMQALHPQHRSLRGMRVLPRLIATLFVDIVRSNYAVARLLLIEGRRSDRQSRFLSIDLQLRSPSGLAILAIILTATPGTAWVEYVSESGTLVLHVFDGAEQEHYRRVVTQVYGPMLQEIFE